MTTLLEEIQAKCSAELIASRDHGAIAATVNAGRTTVQKVAIADVQAYLQGNGLWWVIKVVAADDLHTANAAAVAVMDVANARYPSIDMTLPIVGQMLGGLVATGVIAQGDMDALVGMGVVPDTVTVHQINQALVSDGGDWLGG
jgi:hypothetical protein